MSKKEYLKVTFLEMAKVVFPGVYTPEGAKQYTYLELEGVPKKGPVIGPYYYFQVEGYYLWFECWPKGESNPPLFHGIIKLSLSPKLMPIVYQHSKLQKALVFRGRNILDEKESFMGDCGDYYISLFSIDEILPLKGEPAGLSLSKQNLEGRLTLTEEEK